MTIFEQYNDHKVQGEWKIPLTMEINFLSFKVSNETRTMHTTSNNIEIIIANETDEIIKISRRITKISERK